MCGTTGLPPESLLEPMNERMDAGEGRRAKETLIIALKESRTEGSRKRVDGRRRREGEKGCSNGVFVLVGVTPKASAEAAQLGYRYQTQRIRREECVCVSATQSNPTCLLGSSSCDI